MSAPVVLGALAAVVGGVALSRQKSASPSEVKIKEVTVPSGAVASIDGTEVGVVIVDAGSDPANAPSARSAVNGPVASELAPAQPASDLMPSLPSEPVQHETLAMTPELPSEPVGSGGQCVSCSGGGQEPAAVPVHAPADVTPAVSADLYRSAVEDGSSTLTLVDASRKLKSVGPKVGAIW